MDNAIYKSRRINLSEKLPKNSVLLIPGANTQYRNADSAYAFRQDSNFYYLSGFCEPDSLMAIINNDDGRHSIIFVPPKDKLKEIWDGYRAGPIGAVEDFLFDKAFDNTHIDAMLPDILHGSEQVLYPIGKKSGFDQKVIDWTTAASSKDRHSKSINIMDASSLIGNIRLIKDDHEIDLIRKACNISAEAHIAAMQKAHAGVFEFELEAEIMAVFMRNGARSPAYPSIVGGGENACILHYTDNKDSVADGELVLIDAGAEYGCYAADITRTFPVNGSFTAEQKALYEITLIAQEAAIQCVRPGNNAENVHMTALKHLVEGLIDIGLLVGDVDSIIEQEAYSHLYMHRTGHWLGLDVHDVGAYRLGDYHLNLESGMVLTVEPGIYISDRLAVPKGQPEIDERWKGIGIRIEDDVLVTKDSAEVLSISAAKNLIDLEK